MLVAVMALAMGVPAGAACGKAYARKIGMNETAHAALAALLPPYGAFCALNLLIED